MTPVYIAGSFGAPTPEEINRNVARACALGRYAALLGFAPLVPHSIGRLGCHGSWKEDDGGATRQRALDSGVALAQVIAKVDGKLWILLRDDGTMSNGTKLEFDAWLAEAMRLHDGSFVPSPAVGTGGGCQRYTWAQWVDVAGDVDHVDLEAIAAEVLDLLQPVAAAALSPKMVKALGAAADMTRGLADEVEHYRAEPWLTYKVEPIGGQLGDHYEFQATAPGGYGTDFAWPGEWALIDGGLGGACIYEPGFHQSGLPGQLLCWDPRGPFPSQVLLRRRKTEGAP